MESTVVYNQAGKPITTWCTIDPLICPRCHYAWRSVCPATVKEVICPHCHAPVPLAPEPPDAPDFDGAVSLDILHEWTPLMFRNNDALIDAAPALAVSLALRAPHYFWDELARYPGALIYADLAFPLDERDFAVPVAPGIIRYLNDAYGDGDSATALGALPQGVYRRGVFSTYYAVLDRMAAENRFNPLYEWQKFLQLLRSKLTLLELCPALEAVQEDPDL